jgi:hypothetical protein
VDIAHCLRADSDTALIVPAYLDTSYPFTDPSERPAIARTLAQAYVSARLADMPVALTRESDGIGGDARLYLAPSVKQLLGPTAIELERLAAGGACVYVSYSPGNTDWHRGPSYGRLNAMFGVRHQLASGLVNPIEDDEVTFTATRDFGALCVGTRLSFHVSGNEHSRAFLPVVPDGAEVIATDGHGRPALLLRTLGAGSLVLCTYPVEHMAARTPRVNPDSTVALYDALAVHAGVSRPVTIDDPRIGVDILVHEDGRQFVWLVSQAAEQVTVKPALADGFRLTRADGNVAGAVTIEPFGIEIFFLGGTSGTGAAEPGP